MKMGKLVLEVYFVEQIEVEDRGEIFANQRGTEDAVMCTRKHRITTQV